MAWQKWTVSRKNQAIGLYQSGSPVGATARAMATNRRHIRAILKEAGIPIRPQGIAQTGEHNPAWTGGRTKIGGYWYIYKPDHPNATSHGYVAEHRLVMEIVLDRLLLPKEVVHHKDRNRENNSPANLEVFGSNGEHLAFELKGRCPKWSAQGYANMLAAAERKRRQAETRRQQTGDAPA